MLGVSVKVLPGGTSVKVAVTLGLTVTVKLPVGVALALELGVTLGVLLEVAEGVPVNVVVGDTDPVAVLVKVGLDPALGVEVAVSVGLPVAVAVPEGVSVEVADGVTAEQVNKMSSTLKSKAPADMGQEILDDILKLKKEINPDLIFIPSLNDIHQDHATIALEAVRAFKFTTILCYEMPWNNFNFATTCFVKLDEEFIDIKIQALLKYKSQAHRSYANEEFIRALARTRGVQINSRYAEVFEVIRWIN